MSQLHTQLASCCSRLPGEIEVEWRTRRKQKRPSASAAMYMASTIWTGP
jgi:hypothetical protein